MQKENKMSMLVLKGG
ncbi:hypothetical protein [Streptococcus equi]